MRTSVLSTISQSKSNISARLVQIKEIIVRYMKILDEEYRRVDTKRKDNYRKGKNK